jgi:hypothetical protein
MISFSSDAAYARLKIRLFGEDLDPTKVNATLGISATDFYKKGDSFSKGKNIRKNGMWGLDLKREGSSPCDDLKSFAETAHANVFPVSNIDGVTSGSLALWIDTSDPTNTFELSIDPEDIELMNKLGVQFYLTTFPEIAEE